MMAHTHIAFGIFLFLLFSPVIGIKATLPLLGIIAIFSILPDIDTPKSILGTILFPISTKIFRKYGHRTITHSLRFLLSIAIITAPLLFWNHQYYFAAILGVLSHLISDGFNTSGVPLEYPNTRPYYFMPEKLLINVGSPGEWLYFGVFIFANAALGGITFFGFRSIFHSILPSFSGTLAEYKQNCDGPGEKHLCYVQAYVCDEYCGPVQGIALGIHNGKLIIKGDRYYTVGRYSTQSLKLELKEEVIITNYHQNFQNSYLNLRKYPGITSISGELEGSFYCPQYQTHLELHSILSEDLKCTGWVTQGFLNYKIREVKRKA